LIHTHLEHEVVETLLVDALECLLQLKSEFHEECQVRPAHLNGIIGLKQKEAIELVTFPCFSFLLNEFFL
jgi:hypothetical protein